MITLLPHTQAEREHRHPSQVQCISPYLNPAHVLAPPRDWLEHLIQGECGWPFFRLRYKHLLRKRFQAEPERFFTLLAASEGEQELVLTCHCLTDHCHRDVARAFLEYLRSQPAYRRWRNRRQIRWSPQALIEPPAARAV